MTLAIAVALSVLAAAADARAPAKPQRLRVVMSGNYMPMHGVDPSGAFMGFEADLAAALAEATGAELYFLTAKERAKTTIDTVAEGKADVAINAITPSAERAKKVDFSKPYIVLRVRAATTTGAPASAPSSWKDKQVALVDGPWTKAVQAKLRGARVKVVTSPEKAIALLDDGSVEYVVGEDVGLIAAAGRPGLSFLVGALADSPIAMAVPKGQAKKYDDALARLKVSELAAKWKVGEPEEPAGARSKIYVGFCHQGHVEPLGYVAGDGELRIFDDREAMNAEMEAELEFAEWFALVDGKARPVRPTTCARKTVAVTSPADAATPPGQAGTWLRVSGIYLQAEDYREDSTCSYTDSPGTYACGESGYRLSMVRNGQLTMQHRTLDKWGD